MPGVTAQVGFGSSLRVSLVQLLHGGLREAHRDSALAILVHGMALFGTATPHTHCGRPDHPSSVRSLDRVVCLCPLPGCVPASGQGWAVEDNLPLPPSTAAEGGQGAQPAVGTAVAFFVHALAMEVRHSP